MEKIEELAETDITKAIVMLQKLNDDCIQQQREFVDKIQSLDLTSMVNSQNMTGFLFVSYFLIIFGTKNMFIFTPCNVYPCCQTTLRKRGNFFFNKNKDVGCFSVASARFMDDKTQKKTLFDARDVCIKNTQKKKTKNKNE